MAADKGLGKGLTALFGEAANSENIDCVNLKIELIESSDKQPRTTFDEDALAELADSIKQHGIIQPLTVRKLHTGAYQIIAGERRWRAARLAGLLEAPVRIVDADDRKAAQLALVENLQREDLNPIEEAKGFKRLIDDYYFTQEEAAISVGKSRSAVANSLRLLSLPHRIQLEVENKRISTGHAKVIMSLKDEAAQLRFMDAILLGNLSVREAERKVKRFAKEPSSVDTDSEQSTRDTTNSMYLAEIARDLEEAIGRKVRVTGNGTIGSITIDYYSTDDLEILTGILSEVASVK